jgi:hypothetical protein
MTLLAQVVDGAGAGRFLTGLLCALAVMLVIGTVIGAIILRAACALYNKLVGGPKTPTSVPEPDFGRAMGIIFVAWLVNLAAGFMLSMVFAGGVGADRVQTMMAQAISIPIGFLVLAGMIAGMLPTTFGRALLVALLYLLIAVIVGVTIGFVVAIVLLALGGLSRV